MKPAYLLLFAVLLALGSCTGKSADKAPAQQPSSETTSTAQAESEPTAEPQPEKVPPLERTLTAGKVSFTLSCSNESAEKNVLCAQPQGLEVRNDQLCLDVEGQARDAFQADLNKDGFIEVYTFTAGPDARGHLYGFASYRNRSYGPINVREPKDALLQGYQGQDAFYVKEGQIKREFPLYNDNGQLSGQRRVITYQLKQGETSFILEPGNSETVN
ncbi:MAG: hypothetical protein KDD02_03475 [Phaeodactylibacter sp.]|nr:hypothetical protein [Phaeodactylibacter sp.]MCB9302534.1 hypothetical protein [Lewinellaceae bacterium]